MPVSKAEIEKQRSATAEFYKKLQEEDKEKLDIITKEYSDNPELQKAFIDGYNKSIEFPSSYLIHMIALFAYDYTPHADPNIKNVVSKIRTIFWDKIHG